MSLPLSLSSREQNKNLKRKRKEGKDFIKFSRRTKQKNKR